MSWLWIRVTSTNARRGKTYSEGGEQYARAGEEVVVIETLPNGVSPANAVCVNGDLCSPLSDLLQDNMSWRAPTSVSNQNFLGNCMKIFVYVPYIFV
jgi:hypothetical protein